MKIPWHIEGKLLARREIDDNECWNYIGAKTQGYGMIGFGGRNYGVHRVAWFLWVGVIPKGKHLHHTCENRACFNPEHLKLTDAGAHARHHHIEGFCSKGHDLNNPANVYSYQYGKKSVRVCRPCALARSRAQREKEI